jgi:hypothetical protein
VEFISPAADAAAHQRDTSRQDRPEQSGSWREFSLEGMLESFTQRKNVTVNLAF